MTQIDVHVVFTDQYDKQADLDALLGQLADEPVTPHVVAGSTNTLWRSRIEGYSSGSAPFVTYCDPDDSIAAGAFRKLSAAIEAFPGERYFGCNEVQDFPDREAYAAFRSSPLVLNRLHHLQCIHRDVMNPDTLGGDGSVVAGQDFISYVDAIERLGSFIYLDLPLYRWKRHNPNSLSRTGLAIVNYGVLQRRLMAANPLVTILSEKDFTGDALTGKGVRYLLRDIPGFPKQRT
jgi:hypothetical protein